MLRMLPSLLFSFLFCCVSVPAFAVDEHKILEIGSPAPDFNLKGTDGKMYSLASFKKAKVLVIIFTCNHCPTSQAYEERIKKIVTDYKDKGVEVVAISPNSTMGLSLSASWVIPTCLTRMKTWCTAQRIKNFNFPYLFDGETQAASEKYGPVATPHVFIFDSESKLSYQGRIDDMEDPEKTPSMHDTRNAIEALVAGKEVSVLRPPKFLVAQQNGRIRVTG